MIKNCKRKMNLKVKNAVKGDKFYPYADITPQEAKEVFRNFMRLLDLEESMPDVFVTNYSEYYTVEQTAMTVLDIYALYYP